MVGEHRLHVFVVGVEQVEQHGCLSGLLCKDDLKADERVDDLHGFIAFEGVMLAGQGVENLQGLKETLNATFDALQRLFRVSHYHVTIERASENVKVR